MNWTLLRKKSKLVTSWRYQTWSDELSFPSPLTELSEKVEEAASFQPSFSTIQLPTDCWQKIPGPFQPLPRESPRHKNRPIDRSYPFQVSPTPFIFYQTVSLTIPFRPTAIKNCAFSWNSAQITSQPFNTQNMLSLCCSVSTWFLSFLFHFLKLCSANTGNLLQVPSGNYSGTLNYSCHFPLQNIASTIPAHFSSSSEETCSYSLFRHFPETLDEHPSLPENLLCLLNHFPLYATQNSLHKPLQKSAAPIFNFAS